MSKARTFFVVGGGIVLAIALAVFIEWRNGRGSSASIDTETAAAGKDAHTSVPTPTGTPELPSASTRDVVATEPGPEQTDAGEEDESDFEISFDLHGRVVGQGSDGRELEPQDGRFQLTVFCGDIGRTIDVGVHSGKWQAKGEGVHAADTLSVSNLESGEFHPWLVQPEDRLPIPASHEIEIGFRIPRPVQLRVLDKASGADLRGIEVVSSLPFPLDEATHPGAEFQSRVLGRGQDSPIAMDQFRDPNLRHQNCHVLVGVPGYAWGFAKLDFDLGGEFVVLLDRGGDLDVTVNGIDVDVQTHLRIRSAAQSSPVCDETLTRDGTISFVGLAPGAYSVRGELGDWFDHPVILGEATVDVSAGKRVRAELSLAAAPQVVRADSGGIVYIPSEWKAESPTLEMRQFSTPSDGAERYVTLEIQATESTREGFDAYRWIRQRVEVGKYELGTSDPSFSIVIDVPPGGRSDFELVVPPPIELSVFIVDGATGAEVVTDELLWNPRRPEGVDGGGLERALRDAAGHRCVVRAPACEIELQLQLWDYQAYDGVVDLSKGVRAHTIRLERSCGVTLKLEDGDKSVAFPSEWQSKITAVSGNGEQSLSDFGEFARRMMVTLPGTYSIEIPKLPGYRQVPPQTIEVLAGRFTEHIVQLEREHP